MKECGEGSVTDEAVDRLPDCLPPKDNINMTRPVPKNYRDGAMEHLKNFRCKGEDYNVLLSNTQPHNINGDKVYLYWMEEGGSPFGGAVCEPCYMKSQPKRKRGQRERKPLPGET